MHTRDGHPLVGSLKISVLIIINIINIKAINNISIPISDAIANGAVEKATIPSILYNNNFQKDHFVSPATLSTFSNSIHFVLNPTQPNSPLLKRLYSFNSNKAFTNCLVIKR